MKVTYDADVDLLRIVLNPAAIEEKPGIILDCDEDDNVVGVEILDSSRRLENPRSLEYAVTG